MKDTRRTNVEDTQNIKDTNILPQDEELYRSYKSMVFGKKIKELYNERLFKCRRFIGTVKHKIEIFYTLELASYKNSLCKKVKNIDCLIMNNKKQFIIATLIVMVLVSGITVYDANMGYKVIFNGKDIGMVREKETFIKAVRVVNEELSDKHNIDIIFDQDVEFKKEFIDRDKLLIDIDHGAQAVYNTGLELSVNAAILNIQGKEVVGLASKKDMQMVLSGVLKPFTEEASKSELVGEPKIQEKYWITEKRITLDSLSQVDEAIDLLSRTTNKIKKYKMNNGDTTWDIAANRGVKIDELKKVNPDKDISKLHDGDVINLTAQEPYLTVMTVKEEITEEAVQYNTVNQEDSSLYIGKTKVISEGESGIRQITTEVNFENGMEVSREVRKNEIIKKPQDKVIAKGTKKLPPGIKNGRFQMPTSGRISAIDKAGSHSGSRAVDIANSLGTSVRASASGTVIKASNSGSLGNCIIIDHGNGYKTIYGHLSSFNVSEGSQVSAGEQIGAMGSTGNSTGSHLHFEIRKNGEREIITDYFNLAVGMSVSP